MDQEEKIIDPATFNEFRAVMGDSLAEVLTKYIADTDNLMEALRKAWRNEDMKGITHAAHALKSPSHQIGALSFKNVLATIECHAAKGEKKPIMPMMDEAESQCAAVKKALANIMCTPSCVR